MIFANNQKVSGADDENDSVKNRTLTEYFTLVYEEITNSESRKLTLHEEYLSGLACWRIRTNMHTNLVYFSFFCHINLSEMPYQTEDLYNTYLSKS